MLVMDVGEVDVKLIVSVHKSEFKIHVGLQMAWSRVHTSPSASQMLHCLLHSVLVFFK